MIFPVVDVQKAGGRDANPVWPRTGHVRPYNGPSFKSLLALAIVAIEKQGTQEQASNKA